MRKSIMCQYLYVIWSVLYERITQREKGVLKWRPEDQPTLLWKRATCSEDKTAIWSRLARGQSIIQQLCFNSAFIPSALALLHNWILSGISKRRKVGYENRRNNRKMNATWRPFGRPQPLNVVTTLVFTHTLALGTLRHGLSTSVNCNKFNSCNFSIICTRYGLQAMYRSYIRCNNLPDLRYS